MRKTTLKQFCGLAVYVLLSVPVLAAGFMIKNNDRVVFLGDSITEQKLYTTYIEAYALTRHPDWKLTFRNVGWGGDTAWLRQRAHPDEKMLFAAKGEEQAQMIQKSVGAGLARDVLPLQPTVVTIKFGMNDHSYQAFRPDIFSAYVGSQTELVKVLKKNGARVALLTSQPIEDRRPDPDKDVRNESLRKFSDGLGEVAKAQGATFVDQFAPYLSIMMRERASDPKAFIGGGDAVHPGPAGHTIMAWAVLKGLGATAQVSEAEINAARKSAKAKNCKVTKIKFAGDTLTFDRLDEALPMPIDPRAEAALKLAPILNELDSYQLKVTGLKADSYEVLIDGEAAATLTKEELASGWNMTMAKGPITKQAQEVLRLIFKKNDAYFNRWRNVQLKAGRQAELPALDQQIADLETQINAARLPKLHHFELKPAAK
jgi:lysophospholipase L1-like esterase